MWGLKQTDFKQCIQGFQVERLDLFPMPWMSINQVVPRTSSDVNNADSARISPIYASATFARGDEGEATDALLTTIPRPHSDWPRTQAGLEHFID